jgi:hypothetical protein
MPLDFAEHLANKYPEESERQAIVDFLRDWDPEQHEVDDAAIVNGARRISGLDGGVKLRPIKKAVQSFCQSYPKTAVVVESGAAGAATGAGIQGIQEGVSWYRGQKEDGSLGRIWEQVKAGAREGIAGDAARHSVQKVAGKVPGAIAEGTAIEATRCAIDNSGGIIQDLWGIAGGAAGTVLGGRIGRPLIGGMVGEAIGEEFSKILESAGEWIGEKVSDVLFSKEIEETKKPAAKKEVPQIKRPDPPPAQKKSSTSGERYYCESCHRYFWESRSKEIKKNSRYWSPCSRCGRLAELSLT